jgi:hypothetical protein
VRFISQSVFVKVFTIQFSTEPRYYCVEGGQYFCVFASHHYFE